MNRLHVFFCALLITGAAFAQSNGPSRVGLHFSLAARGGLGTAADGSEDVVESRGMFYYGAEGTIGLRWGNVVIGGTADYIFWEQRDDAKDVDDTDMSGTQLVLSPTIGYAVGRFLLQGKFPLVSNLTLKQEDAAGNKVTYTDQTTPSIGVQIKFRLAGSSFVGLEYTKTTYETMEVDGEESKLDSDTAVTYSAWGLMYGFIF